MTSAGSLPLSPSWCFRQPLGPLPVPAARLALRAVLTLTAGSIRVEGHERLAALRVPAILALSHPG